MDCKGTDEHRLGRNLEKKLSFQTCQTLLLCELSQRPEGRGTVIVKADLQPPGSVIAMKEFNISFSVAFVCPCHMLLRLYLTK